MQQFFLLILFSEVKKLNTIIFVHQRYNNYYEEDFSYIFDYVYTLLSSTGQEGAE